MQTGKLFLFLSLAITGITSSTFATIRRVNNTPGLNVPYSTPSAAIAAAQPGDTIHFESSSITYSDVLVNKKLVLTGTGYFLEDVVPNPNTQALLPLSTIANLTFQAGSKGSVAQGLTITNFCNVSDSFITLQRNYINVGINLGYNSGTYADTIRNNFFAGNGRINASSNTHQAQGLLIYNNIFAGTNYIIQVTNLANCSGYFLQNSLTAPLSLTNIFNCNNFTFQNNIFCKVDFGVNQNANIFLNNIANTGIPTTNNNQVGINPDNVYLGWASATGYSSDGRYKLKPGSPALAAGILNGNTVDCGAFGGPAPYILSGIPPVASIYQLSVPAQVSSGTANMNVTLSATTQH